MRKIGRYGGVEGGEKVFLRSPRQEEKIAQARRSLQNTRLIKLVLDWVLVCQASGVG